MPACAFMQSFATVEDPRIARSKRHLLVDVLFMSVAATIAGCDGPTEIADFTKEKLSWFQRFIPLENGVPSHDTIGRVLSLIKPEQFQQAFLDWIAAFAVAGKENDDEHSKKPEHIAVDGKTMCGSHGAKDRAHPLHLVSAWASQQSVTLGQVAVDDESNEITAIPRLLETLELSGAIVSIDAMGCQKEIAKKIVAGGGDYVLAVKNNQPTLYEDVNAFFLARHENQDFAEYGCRQYKTVETSRGRHEERYYMVAPLPATMKRHRPQWQNLKSIGQVITVIETEQGTKHSDEIRYYIQSRPPKVKEFASSVRSHWLIESMHWVLDVVFHEDASRIRERNGATNFSFLRKFVISLLKRDKSQGSLKGKRKRAGWNTGFLENLLFSK